MKRHGGHPNRTENPSDAGIHKWKRPDDRERELSGYGEKSIVRAEENDESYGLNIIIGIEDFPALDFEKPKEDAVYYVSHALFSRRS